MKKEVYESINDLKNLRSEMSILQNELYSVIQDLTKVREKLQKVEQDMHEEVWEYEEKCRRR